jgi:hypothetical protein
MVADNLVPATTLEGMTLKHHTRPGHWQVASVAHDTACKCYVHVNVNPTTTAALRWRFRCLLQATGRSRYLTKLLPI